MHSPSSTVRPRKRRAINACVGCRASKVRCDGKRPCGRCETNNVQCHYHDVVKDENLLRIEKLEADLAALRDEIHTANNHQHDTIAGSSSVTTLSAQPRQRHSMPSAVDTGLITWDQATLWFQGYYVFHLSKED
jgi:methylphosphotriester-DNA--protein-cysteine methyltransferase